MFFLSDYALFHFKYANFGNKKSMYDLYINYLYYRYLAQK